MGGIYLTVHNHLLPLADSLVDRVSTRQTECSKSKDNYFAITHFLKSEWDRIISSFPFSGKQYPVFEVNYR